MKINTIKSNRLNKKGMTLIEISLVVALLLSLIAILFLGIAAYKRGADRSKCILQIASVQKSVRSHQNMFEGVVGGALIHTATLMGAGLYFENVLTCPDTTGVYAYQATFPAVGVAYVDCSLAGGTTLHVPSSLAGW